MPKLHVPKDHPKVFKLECEISGGFVDQKLVLRLSFKHQSGDRSVAVIKCYFGTNFFVTPQAYTVWKKLSLAYVDTSGKC